MNVASRLEELTKTYGTPIIAGARTAEAAAGFAFLEIDAAPIRGKDRPERIFALIGDEALAASDRFRALVARLGALREALAKGARAEAGEMLAQCRALDWPGLAPLFAFYERRLGATA